MPKKGIQEVAGAQFVVLRDAFNLADPTFWRLSVGLGIQFLTLETITDALIRRKHVHIRSQTGERPFLMSITQRMSRFSFETMVELSMR